MPRRDIVELSPAARQARKALVDCRVIRTRFDHPGFIELFDLELADCRPVDGDDNVLDWRLL